MNNLMSIIEAILFASGDPVPTDIICEKLECSQKELNKAIEELEKKYNEDSGIRLLQFNKKLQFSTNPILKDAVASVLNPIKEKEFSRTILESSAIIAYKQPITKSELEGIRGGLSSDYAISMLLELQMIEVVGKKDTVGRPNLYGTTDNFLKRFNLKSLDDLPDYDVLMDKIAEIRSNAPEDETYLYDKPVYQGEENEETQDESSGKKRQSKQSSIKNFDFEIPEHLKDLEEDDIIKIE